MAIKQYFITDEKPQRGLLAAEWVIMGYMVFTLIVMAFLWPRLVNVEPMLMGRLRYVGVTLLMWGVYRYKPCRATMLARIGAQLGFLGWWYPDTYEMNRLLPNLDHVFASLEQSLFGCHPSLLFSQAVPYGWFSELMCMGYVSYFPLIATVTIYYFLKRYEEFQKATFVILASFFIYYVIFVLLPVTGPQFYYLAVGTENIAAGIFSDVGDWFLTHSERLAAPGWSDGFFYHLLEMTHDAGERPTAAFPSSHVGCTTVLMMLALHTRSRRLVLSMLPFYVLMCFSTVYIYAHYVIDAIAGLFTGIMLYYLLTLLYNRYKA
ncbi:MAG: phosphatase PAP2 family protein [Prevotella sp.]|nr:phosphatase PAP2 family protein [Prevotella sp.]